MSPGPQPFDIGGRRAAGDRPERWDGDVSVNGVSLHFVERGAGEPIVFIHGSLVDFREWGPVADQLVGDYRTLTYSRRYNYPNDNAIAGGDHSARRGGGRSARP